MAWIEEIIVGEASRRLGIGRKLTEAFEAWAQERDAKVIALATRRAAEFYGAMGYEESATYLHKMLGEDIHQRPARAIWEKLESARAQVPNDPPDPEDALNQ